MGIIAFLCWLELARGQHDELFSNNSQAWHKYAEGNS